MRRSLLAFCFFALGASASPSRVVSLAPSITETVFALGAGASLVGVTRFCDRPLAAQKIRKAGGLFDAQLEVILGLKPDLVLATQSASQASLLAQLQARGIRVIKTSSDTLEQIQNQTQRIGEALGKVAETKALLSRLAEEKAKLTKRLRCHKPLRVAVAVGQGPLLVAGPGTFIDELLLLIGALPAVPRSAPAWPQWSKESLAINKPDVLIEAFKHNTWLQRPGPFAWQDAEKLLRILQIHPACKGPS